MISLVVAAVLLLIHALVCLVLWTLMKLGLLPVRGHMLPVIVLVPLWGPLLVVLLSVCSAVFWRGTERVCAGVAALQRRPASQYAGTEW